jgi:hypothetical protein
MHRLLFSHSWRSWAMVLLLGLLLCPAPVWAWGSATHAHVADRLGAVDGAANLNEIYGAMAMDTFNYLFDPPVVAQTLYYLTHHESMRVWQQARGGDWATRAVAYGYMSHNDDWGADYTAHHRGLTYGQSNGYVIAKTADLMASSSLLPLLGLPDPVANELTHIMVETGVDVLIQTLNPGLGQKIMAAAQVRTDAFPQLLVQAYAQDLTGLYQGDPVALIYGAEALFRNQMLGYGYALTLAPAQAVPLLADQFADFATAFLNSYGLSLPLTHDQIAAFLGGLINEAMVLCQGDFAAEIDQTIAFVDGQLREHGVTPVPVPAALVLLAPALLRLGRRVRRQS